MDHARLREHFTASADPYSADSKRHIDMQCSYGSNPKNPAVASKMAAYCKRLSDVSIESALTVRQLMAEHAKLAGAAARAPRNAALQ